MSRLGHWLREHQATCSAYLLCAVLFAIGTLHSAGFASRSSIDQLLVFASFVGFAALGQTLVILAGGLDLSVPWLMAFGGIELSRLAGAGVAGGLGIVIVVLIGVGIGAINGVGVAWLSVPPIVMTLAVGGLVEAYLTAIGLLQSQGDQVPHVAVALAANRLGPIPLIALVWLAVALLTGATLSRTPFGRRVLAVGANDVVAHLSGMRVARVRLATYAISGGASAFAGVVLSGYVGTTYLDIGAPYLFTSIAAVVVGGASILGGRGSYWGTVAGALTLTVLSAMLPLFKLSDAGLEVVYGVVILAGVWLSGSGRSVLANLLRRLRSDSTAEGEL